MGDKKPFRFSLQSFNTDSPANWRSLIDKTESLGYSTFFLADHFLSEGSALEGTYHPPQMLGAIPAIAMALQQTTTLRVGARVLCNDYRHPFVTAKEAATLDYLSEGRLEFGIGAGFRKNMKRLICRLTNFLNASADLPSLFTPTKTLCQASK
ncbi:MAG: alkanesulfonate monooxygenase SsuD [Bacteroidia bacterium]|jgi:alkanesulfonate monooxygenase SsuD/methylene tetrahydromethanopterin reductase-like flavin-dependent oxidoreductase (luciferase family)